MLFHTFMPAAVDESHWLDHIQVFHPLLKRVWCFQLTPISALCKWRDGSLRCNVSWKDWVRGLSHSCYNCTTRPSSSFSSFFAQVHARKCNQPGHVGNKTPPKKLSSSSVQHLCHEVEAAQVEDDGLKILVERVVALFPSILVWSQLASCNESLGLGIFRGIVGSSRKNLHKGRSTGSLSPLGSLRCIVDPIFAIADRC